MNVTTRELSGLLLIEPRVFGDSRGYFLETWNDRHYREHGMAVNFVQDNASMSRRGTLRGLHFQNPCPQAKLISVAHGEVFDVCVDLRRGSATFGRWHGIHLSAGDGRQLFIPTGFAHAFLVLSETAVFQYKCTDFYSPTNELAIRWNDPDLDIQWPVRQPILSDKDAHAPLLRDLPRERLFE